MNVGKLNTNGNGIWFLGVAVIILIVFAVFSGIIHLGSAIGNARITVFDPDGNKLINGQAYCTLEGFGITETKFTDYMGRCNFLSVPAQMYSVKVMCKTDQTNYKTPASFEVRPPAFGYLQTTKRDVTLPRGCGGGSSCTPFFRKICQGTDGCAKVYWQDSCGVTDYSQVINDCTGRYCQESSTDAYCSGEVGDTVCGGVTTIPTTSTLPSCNPNLHVACFGGSVYYYDCNWQRTSLKTTCSGDCSNGQCTGVTTTICNQQEVSRCSGGSVWWHDCNDNPVILRYNCGSQGCSGGLCVGSSTIPTTIPTSTTVPSCPPSSCVIEGCISSTMRCVATPAGCLTTLYDQSCSYETTITPTTTVTTTTVEGDGYTTEQMAIGGAIVVILLLIAYVVFRKK